MGWTAASKKAFNKIIEMDLTKVFVEEVNESSLSVLLYKTENNKDICINGLLVKKGYAISVGPRYVMSMIAAYVSDDFLEIYFLFNTFAIATIQIIPSYSLVRIYRAIIFYSNPLICTSLSIKVAAQGVYRLKKVGNSLMILIRNPLLILSDHKC